MILTVALLNIVDRRLEGFKTAFKMAELIIASIKGYSFCQLKKCNEDENKYILLINLETIKNHKIGFRTSKKYHPWKALLHHFYNPFPTV